MDDQSVQLTGFGKGIRITGPNSFLLAVIIFLIVAVVYLLNFSLKSWGDPFPIRNRMDEHAVKNSAEHTLIAEALDRNTYVQLVCSPNNTNRDAKEKCSGVDLSKPESFGRYRRYRAQPGKEDE